MNALDKLRLVFPHHKEITGQPCDPEKCYRCQIEAYALTQPKAAEVPANARTREQNAPIGGEKNAQY